LILQGLGFRADSTSTSSARWLSVSAKAAKSSRWRPSELRPEVQGSGVTV